MAGVIRRSTRIMEEMVLQLARYGQPPSSLQYGKGGTSWERTVFLCSWAGAGHSLVGHLAPVDVRGPECHFKPVGSRPKTNCQPVSVASRYENDRRQDNSLIKRLRPALFCLVTVVCSPFGRRRSSSKRDLLVWPLSSEPSFYSIPHFRRTYLLHTCE